MFIVYTDVREYKNKSKSTIKLLSFFIVLFPLKVGLTSLKFETTVSSKSS